MSRINPILEFIRSLNITAKIQQIRDDKACTKAYQLGYIDAIEWVIKMADSHTDKPVDKVKMSGREITFYNYYNPLK